MTSLSLTRNASASWAQRLTISPEGCAVGRAVMPSWRSIKTRAVAESRLVDMSEPFLRVTSGRTRALGGPGYRLRSRVPRRAWRRSVERRLHQGCEKLTELSDVVEIVDVQDGFFDGGLPVGRDDSVGQLGVLVSDVRVRQVSVAGTAWVHDLGGASGPVVEGHAQLGSELLIGREAVVGLFMVNDRSVNQLP